MINKRCDVIRLLCSLGWLDLQLLLRTGNDAQRLLTPEGNQCLFYS